MLPHEPSNVNPTRDMSLAFTKMPSLAMADPRLTDAAFRLYAVFIDTVNETDVDPSVWLSRATMAAKCGKSKSSVKSMDKALGVLVECGYIQVRRERHGQTTRYMLTEQSLLDPTYGQSTTGNLGSNDHNPVVNQPHPPMVERPHNQEPLTKNPYQEPLDQEPVNYSTADADDATEIVDLSLQGKGKDAPKKGEFNHRNGDSTTDRFIRWVGIAKGFETRDQVWEWLRIDWGTGWTYDVGQWDASDWLGALRRLIGGFDGVRKHNDRELRELVETAKGKLEGLEWLVEYVQDLQWATTASNPLVASAAATEAFADPWGTRAPSPVTSPSVGRTGLYVGGPVQW